MSTPADYSPDVRWADALTRDRDLTCDAVRIGAHLLAQAADTQRADTSPAAIADTLGIEPLAARRALDQLTDRGWITPAIPHGYALTAPSADADTWHAAVMRDHTLPISARCIGIEIWSRTLDGNAQQIDAGTIAAALGMSERTARRGIAALTAAGWISDQGPRRYTLTMPDGDQ